MSVRLSWSKAETLRSTNSPIFAVDFAHLFGDFARQILIDLNDLQLKLGNFALGLRNRANQLPALTAKTRCFTFELAEAGYRNEVFLKELADAGELIIDKVDFLLLGLFLRAKSDDLFVGLVDALLQLRLLAGTGRSAQIEKLVFGRENLCDFRYIGLAESVHREI